VDKFITEKEKAAETPYEFSWGGTRWLGAKVLRRGD
tara:strand:- start:196 stop:303 length:108 start_codon:yes stop_codon:yes gene_type:complete